MGNLEDLKEDKKFHEELAARIASVKRSIIGTQDNIRAIAGPMGNACSNQRGHSARVQAQRNAQCGSLRNQSNALSVNLVTQQENLAELEAEFAALPALIPIIDPVITFINAQFQDVFSDIFSTRKLLYEFFIDASGSNIDGILKLEITTFDGNLSNTKMVNIPFTAGESFNWLAELQDPIYLSMIDPVLNFKITLDDAPLQDFDFMPVIVLAPIAETPEIKSTDALIIGGGIAVAVAVGVGLYLSKRKS